MTPRKAPWARLVATPVLRAIVIGIALATLDLPAVHAQEPKIGAPNVVPISANLVTAGQPTAKSLAEMRALGFEAVIYLAPPTVSDAVPGEADIIRRQGVEFLNIPIPFDNPKQADYEALSAALVRLRGRKVLVHCQVNMRASTLVFLHRVIVDKEPPDKAYEAVLKIWSPRGPWKELADSLLRKNGIAFETY